MLPILLQALVVPSLASSYTRLDDGTRVRWQGEGDDLPYIPVVVNASNASGLAGYEVEGAVVRALLAWQAATNFGFTFDVWVGRERALYPASQAVDGYTTIHFASSNPDAFGLTARQAGFATLAFDGETGAIYEADIALNDVQFAFSADELDSNYADRGFLGKTAFLDDVVLHEVGHLLGLGHTGVGTATMFPAAWTGQHTLGCADALGARDLYLPSQGTSTIRGRVDVERAREWPGVEVLVIGQRLRRVVASAFTDADGNYEITGLSSGLYVVLAQPYPGEPTDLPSPLGENVQLPCDVSRGFSAPFQLDARQVEEIDLVLPCDGGADLAPTPSNFDAPINLPFDADNQILAVYRIEPGVDHWFRLPRVEGALSLDILSPSLFSASVTTGIVTDEKGEQQFAEFIRPLEPSHDAPRQDARVNTFVEPTQERYLLLQATRLRTDLYPGGENFVDERSYAVFAGSVAGRFEAPGDCHPQDLSAYVSPGGFPQRSWNPIVEEPSRGCGATTVPYPGPLGLGMALGLGALLTRRSRSRPR